jgi:excisionase family DNA binding protein
VSGERIVITLDEASALTGATKRQLRALIRKGTLPASRPVGSRNYYVAESDLRRVFAPVVQEAAQKMERRSENQRAADQLAKAGISVRQ